MPGIQDIYSVNVSNRYALGGDTDDEESDTAQDYDPLDTLKSLEDQKKRAVEEAKKKKQALANKAKNQKKPARFQENKDSNIPVKKDVINVPPKSVKPPRQQNADNKRKDGPPRVNNRRLPREKPNFGEGDENRRPPRRRNEPRTDSATAKGEGLDQPKGDQSFGKPAGEFGPRRDRAERYRGGRGVGGNSRGGYHQGGRGFGGEYRRDGRDDRGKREFDRRSGSDRSSVKPSEKRDGAGSRNWGTPGNEIEEEVVEPVGMWKEPVVKEENETVEKETEEKGDEEEQKPEEPSEMTLDEWKAKQEAQAKPTFNIRKPGEGEDQAKWKNMKVLRKISKTEGKQELTIDDQHKRQAKHQVNVNIQFGDNSARGFGGRGRGRGDRGRNRGGRGGRYGGDRTQSRQLMPDVLNEQEFPTLG